MALKQVVKIILDAAMTLLFILLINAFGTGLEFHEVAGLAVGAMVIFHIILNFNWIKGIIKNFSKAPLKTKFMFVLNTLLALGTTLIIATGVLISKVLFPQLAVQDQDFLIAVHKWTSYILLGFIGVHLVIHAKYILNMAKKMFMQRREKVVKYPLIGMGALTLILAVGLIWYQFSAMKIDDYVSEDSLSKQTDIPSQSQTTTGEPPLTSETQATATETTQTESMTQTEAVTENKSSNSKEETSIQTPAQTSALTESEITIETTTSQSIQTTSAQVEQISLEEYLGSLHCTACPKHCLLSNPRCGKGEVQAEKATEKYYSIYGNEGA